MQPTSLPLLAAPGRSTPLTVWPPAGHHHDPLSAEATGLAVAQQCHTVYPCSYNASAYFDPLDVTPFAMVSARLSPVAVMDDGDNEETRFVSMTSEQVPTAILTCPLPAAARFSTNRPPQTYLP